MSQAKPSPRLATPTDLGANAAKDIAGALNLLLADTFALYLKTKNFHWHISGPHFRDYHLLLDEQADQIFATVDVLAERVLPRRVGSAQRSRQVCNVFVCYCLRATTGCRYDDECACVWLSYAAGEQPEGVVCEAGGGDGGSYV